MRRALAGRDAELVVVLPGHPPQARRLRDELGLGETLLLCDPTWATHRAFGLERAGFRAVWLSPSTWWSYARLVARGRRTRLPAQDVRQLGGDVVLDRTGVIAWAYAGRSPADYPSPAEVVRAAEAAG